MFDKAVIKKNPGSCATVCESSYILTGVKTKKTSKITWSLKVAEVQGGRFADGYHEQPDCKSRRAICAASAMTRVTFYGLAHPALDSSTVCG